MTRRRTQLTPLTTRIKSSISKRYCGTQSALTIAMADATLFMKVDQPFDCTGQLLNMSGL